MRFITLISPLILCFFLGFFYPPSSEGHSVTKRSASPFLHLLFGRRRRYGRPKKIKLQKPPSHGGPYGYHGGHSHGDNYLHSYPVRIDSSYSNPYKSHTSHAVHFDYEPPGWFEADEYGNPYSDGHFDFEGFGPFDEEDHLDHHQPEEPSENVHPPPEDRSVHKQDFQSSVPRRESHEDSKPLKALKKAPQEQQYDYSPHHHKNPPQHTNIRETPENSRPLHYSPRPKPHSVLKHGDTHPSVSLNKNRSVHKQDSHSSVPHRESHEDSKPLKTLKKAPQEQHYHYSPHRHKNPPQHTNIRETPENSRPLHYSPPPKPHSVLKQGENYPSVPLNKIRSGFEPSKTLTKVPQKHYEYSHHHVHHHKKPLHHTDIRKIPGRSHLPPRYSSPTKGFSVLKQGDIRPSIPLIEVHGGFKPLETPTRGPKKNYDYSHHHAHHHIKPLHHKDLRRPSENSHSPPPSYSRPLKSYSAHKQRDILNEIHGGFKPSKSLTKDSQKHYDYPYDNHHYQKKPLDHKDIKNIIKESIYREDYPVRDAPSFKDRRRMKLMPAGVKGLDPETVEFIKDKTRFYTFRR